MIGRFYIITFFITRNVIYITETSNLRLFNKPPMGNWSQKFYVPKSTNYYTF